jgi:hypothetical protein
MRRFQGRVLLAIASSLLVLLPVFTAADSAVPALPVPPPPPPPQPVAFPSGPAFVPAEETTREPELLQEVTERSFERAGLEIVLRQTVSQRKVVGGGIEKSRQILVATKRGGTPLQQVQFLNTELTSELMLPVSQPLKDYFFSLKQAGGNSRLMLVTPAGKILTLPAGVIYFPPGGKVLLDLKTRSTEPTELALVNLESGSVPLYLAVASAPSVLEAGKRYRVLASRQGGDFLLEPVGAAKGSRTVVHSQSGSFDVGAPEFNRKGALPLTQILDADTTESGPSRRWLRLSEAPVSPH